MVCICENKMCIGFWCGKLNIGGNLEDVAVDGRIILKWILKKQDIKHQKNIFTHFCV
jgi:hypothetical protein